MCMVQPAKSISRTRVETINNDLNNTKNSLPEFNLIKNSLDSLKENIEILRVCWQTNSGEDRYQILCNLIEEIEEVINQDIGGKINALKDSEVTISTNYFSEKISSVGGKNE